MIKIKDELMSAGLTDEQIKEVIKRFEKHFHLTELEINAGDISIKNREFTKNQYSTIIKCHGRPMNNVIGCDIRLRGGRRPSILLEI